jgi:hypothetical protein
MANKTSKKSAKVAKKAATRRVDAKAAKPRKKAPKSQSRKVAKLTLLAGGNPQIAKGEGDAPVQAYIAAMPGWKRDVGRRLDALIVRTVPGVRKAVHFAAMPRILARRGRVEQSKFGITHATVDRRARTLFARHSSSCRRLCRICVRRG